MVILLFLQLDKLINEMTMTTRTFSLKIWLGIFPFQAVKCSLASVILSGVQCEQKALDEFDRPLIRSPWWPRPL
ncbi:hypothetical protein A6R68_07362, partial [Neotoma lepida]